jgi:hypothetical protein
MDLEVTMRWWCKGFLLCVLVLVPLPTGAYEKTVSPGSSKTGADEITSENQAKPPRFSFRMKDGSTLTGQLEEETITIKSAFGPFTVPVKDIVSYGNGQFRLKDGSVIKGEIVNRALSLTSKYGRLSVEPKDITWFGFQAVPRKTEPNGQGEAKKD